jgi:hypothetical protein
VPDENLAAKQRIPELKTEGQAFPQKRDFAAAKTIFMVVGFGLQLPEGSNSSEPILRREPPAVGDFSVLR